MSAGMDITPLVSPDAQVLGGYYPGGFRISGTRRDGPVIITPAKLIDWSGNIEIEAFANLEDVELLLIGTSNTFELISPKLRMELKTTGISSEAMTTPAACRTYNVLLTEGRQVAAALLPMVE